MSGSEGVQRGFLSERKGQVIIFMKRGQQTENAREPTVERLVGCEESGDLDARTMHASLTHTHTHTYTHARTRVFT